MWTVAQVSVEGDSQEPHGVYLVDNVAIEANWRDGPVVFVTRDYHCLRFWRLELDLPRCTPVCQVVDAHSEFLTFSCTCLNRWQSRVKGRVVSVCGWVHAVRQNVCSIINVDKEKGWTEDASLGYPSSNWEGLGGSTANNDLERSVGKKSFVVQDEPSSCLGADGSAHRSSFDRAQRQRSGRRRAFSSSHMRSGRRCS